MGAPLGNRPRPSQGNRGDSSGQARGSRNEDEGDLTYDANGNLASVTCLGVATPAQYA